jgi:hypothetical protein
MILRKGSNAALKKLFFPFVENIWMDSVFLAEL